MGKTVIMEHPLIKHKMSILRDKNTGTKQFRELMKEISLLICCEATKDLPLEDVKVETPMGVADCQALAGKKIAVVPILRAGLGMVEGALELIPSAKVGHIGLYRNEDTLEPIEYYCKLPDNIGERQVLLVDPMLATGGSAVDALTLLKAKGAKNIRFLCAIAAPQGIERVREAHPDVDIYCGCLDKGLNDVGYIVPGLGDAGDRIFGTV